MDAIGGDADFGPHPEFAAVCELSRCVVQKNCTVEFGQESLRSDRVLGNDALGMAGTVLVDMVENRVPGKSIELPISLQLREPLASVN